MFSPLDRAKNLFYNGSFYSLVLSGGAVCVAAGVKIQAIVMKNLHSSHPSDDNAGVNELATGAGIAATGALLGVAAIIPSAFKALSHRLTAPRAAPATTPEAAASSPVSSDAGSEEGFTPVGGAPAPGKSS